jgi:MFS superfamily sulfate permease-like transporter
MPCGGSAQATGLGESRAGKPANSPAGAISRRHRPSKGGAVFYSAPPALRRMADAVSVEQHVDTTATSFDILGPKPDSGVVIYSIEGPLFFGAAEKLERTLAHIQRPATTLILRMGSVPFIDATGINALEQMVGDFKRHGASVLLVELRPNVRYKLERAGVVAQVGEEHIIDTLDNALQLAKRSKMAAAAKPPVDV